MRLYTKKLIVGASDLDELKHVNNVRYLDWVQEIAKEHWEVASKNSWKDQIVWVVRKHEITYYNSAVLNDVLTIETYIKENQGSISKRIVEFKNNKTDKLLVTSSTDWCLLDKQTFRPKRIPDAISKIFV